MEQVRSWFVALRIRTLPLAISGILMGGMLSKFYYSINYLVIFLAFITAILLQILSNLANDYGDFTKGADNANRLGPDRMTQSGRISPKGMKNAVIIASVLSLISGIILIYSASAEVISISSLLFLFAGLLAISAAIKYTVGKNAFGYSGLGDLFVFIFFGIIAVAGTFYLNTSQFIVYILLPATSIGLLTVAVLNLNNMRDIVNDKNSGKITLAVKLGMKGAKIYHALLIIIAFVVALLFTLLQFESYYQLLFLVTLPLFLRDLLLILENKNARDLDPFLKKQSINTFIFTLIFGIGLML